MADQGRWFKLWVSSKDDPHLSILPIADFGRWCKFGTYLKIHGTDGMVVLTKPSDPLIVHPLQSGFQVATFDAVIDAISRFPNCDISTVTSETNATVTHKIEWRNWLKYQGDFSGDRVRKHRTKNAPLVTAKKRREEKRREEKEPPLPPNEKDAPPSWLPFEVWQSYLDMRKKIKRPLTSSGQKLAIQKLTKLKESGCDPTAVLKQSIFNSWQGLFAPKDEPNNGTRMYPKSSQSNWGKTVTANEVWFCGCYRNDSTPCKSHDHGKTYEEVMAQ